MSECGHPFDRAAPGYDAQFTERRLGRWLRHRIHRHLSRTFPPGSRVLELGCGTGEDAAVLAAAGVQVLATDASLAMLALTREKARERGVAARVRTARFDLRRPERLDEVLAEWCRGGAVDGAFSSFGAWNCIADRRALAAALARRLRPGSALVVVVMGPLCLAESLLAFASGRPAGVARRRSGATAHLDGGGTLSVDYPTPRRLRRELEPWFRARSLAGIGVLLPPSDMAGLVDRWPRLFGVLEPVDRALGRLPASAWIADHYLAVFERRAGSESDSS